MVVRELITVLGFKVDERKLRRFNTRVKQVKTNMKGTGTLFGKFTLGAKKLGGNLTMLGQKFGGILNAIPGLSQLSGVFGATNIKVAAITVAVVALIGVVREATKMFLEFEKGLKGVFRVTEANRKEQQQLKKAALEAGEASIFTTAKAAEAQKFLAQAGLTVQQIIKALPQTLKLAAAAELDLATAARISTTIMKSNGLQVEDLARVNDVLAKTANSTMTDVNMLGEAFGTLGATGRLSGLSIEELSGAFGILADNGIRGSLAGTLLRNMLTDLRSPTKKIQAGFENAGINLGDFIDEAGKFKDFEGLLEQIGNLDDAATKLFLDSFGKASRGKRALEIFIAGGVDNMSQLIGALDDATGTIEKGAKIAFQGLSGAIALYQSRVEAASNQAFEESGLAGTFEQIVRFFSDIIPPLIRALGKNLQPFGQILVRVLRILRVISKFLGFILNIAGKVMQVFFLPLKFALFIIDKLLDGIQEKWTMLVTGIEKGFMGIMDRIKNFFASIVNFVIDKINFLIRSLNTLPKVSIEEIKKIDPLKEIQNNTKKTIVNINQKNNITGLNGGDEIGKNIEEQTRAIFQIELQKMFITAGA
jgi:TP901 family phage tail tape measure protein